MNAHRANHERTFAGSPNKWGWIGFAREIQFQGLLDGEGASVGGWAVGRLGGWVVGRHGRTARCALNNS